MQVAYDHLLGASSQGPRPYTTTRRWIYLRCDFPGRWVCFFGHLHEQTVSEVGSDKTVRRLV